ncbi:MAG TPA: biopolymer transporter ExbD, partial [Candidatus Hydrogenedentes bacterium]|nr:biopolymer transporter ExbD [Candidatus Hydrogenedentota bacterium]
MKFRRADKQRVRANVDLTPLIDVVFQLLIFFMLSAT